MKGVWRVYLGCLENIWRVSKGYLNGFWGGCLTPFQLATPTQLQLVGVGVDFVFPRKKEGTILT